MSDNIKLKRNGKSEPQDPKSIGPWRIGRTIGKGSSGRVKIAKHSVTAQYAAIKIVPKSALTSRMSLSGENAEKMLQAIEREIVIMKLVDHPNVLSLYDVWETSNELYLVMEYIPGGELFDYLVSKGRLPPDESLHYFQQIIHAVSYCHSVNICHRDLKPENLLLDANRNIRVCDFGMSKLQTGSSLLETSCGSPHYASPEIVAGKAYHGAASDIWSCGIILFALLTGRLPFDDPDLRVLLNKVKVGTFEIPAEIEGPARDLVLRMLERDPVKRIKMEAILNHPFFTRLPPRLATGAAEPFDMDAAQTPIQSPNDIHPDLLDNLKTLWLDTPEDEIVEKLLSSEETSEKTIYYLLLKYRNKHLESYNMEPEEDAPKAKSSKPRVISGSSDTSSNAPSPSMASAAVMASNTATVGNKANRPTTPDISSKSSSNPKTKASAAPGQVAAPVQPSRNPSARTAVRVPPPSLELPSLTAPRVTSGRQDDNRALPSLPNRPQSPNLQIPALSVQTATPEKSDRERPVSSMSTNSSGSQNNTGADRPASIAVPQVEDHALQKFFHDIAEQIQFMQSTTRPTSPTNELDTFNLHQSWPASKTGVSATSSPNTSADPSQFDDAEDDVSDATTLSSFDPSSPRIVSHEGQEVGLGLGVDGKPLLTNGHAPKRASTLLRVPPPPSTTRRNTSGGSEKSDKENIRAGRVSFLDQYNVPLPQMMERGYGNNNNKRQVSPTNPAFPTNARAPVTAKPMNVLGKAENGRRPAPLNLSFGSAKSTSGSSPMPSPSLSPRSAFMPSTPTMSQSSPADAGTKRSWFSNLFSFKPATYSLLSMESANATRNECRRLLESFGVQVLLVDAEGAGTLKCRVDEVRDVNGVMMSSKAVRFRVDILPPNRNQTGGMYLSSISLVQEKGALSSFKAVYAQLRREWNFDTGSKSPATATYKSPNMSHQQQPAGHLRAYSQGVQAGWQSQQYSNQTHTFPDWERVRLGQAHAVPSSQSIYSLASAQQFSS